MSANRERRDSGQVFEEELADIRRRSDPAATRDNLVGLAFSGGGIRSATFGLGVLEALKHFGVLTKIHYLSTVSGGGYIGAWLTANYWRAANPPAEQPRANWLARDTDWSASIGHLRRYSNYLSPEVGFFSADTWSMFTIWIRNAMLVQLTVILGVACVLLVPRLLVLGFQHWPSVGNWRWTSIALFILGVVGIAGNQLRVRSQGNVWLMQAKQWAAGLALASICAASAWAIARATGFDPFHGGPVDYRSSGPIALLLVLTGFFLLPVAVRLDALLLSRGNSAPKQINYSQGWVQGAIVVPMLATGYLVGAVLWGETTAGTELAAIDSYSGFFLTAARYWPFPLSVVFFSLWLLSFCSVHSFKDPKAVAAAILAPIVCIVVLHALLCVIMLLLHQWKSDGLAHAFVWAPPLVLLAFSLTIIMLIGMMGRQSTEDVREWWSRLGAWLSIYATAWMVVAVAAVYGPGWVYSVVRDYPKTSLSTIAGWIGTIVSGLVAGHSESTGDETKPRKSNPFVRATAQVAPFVFIAGLLIGVATALDLIVRQNTGDQSWSSLHLLGSQTAFLLVSFTTLHVCVWALLILAIRVDINEFSLNAFYRNRLVRCYLGATRFAPGVRNPQNFTGFDDEDDVKLADLANQYRPAAGPLHLVNCALNLGGSSDLALHTRHSASFTLSPLHCGSDYPSTVDASGRPEDLGYVPTRTYGGTFGAPTLGQAISVSGAAASPNMGYHTSPVVAFLLTVFNVRLGWWFPNPRRATDSSSPLFNLRYIVAELFGGATDKSDFLMISDGGHFENLGVYELVKRRCRVIIASDAECDPHLAFEGLGTLIRVCEVDFGARIVIDVGSLRTHQESPWSSNRCAVGRIEYSDGEVGLLIYLKASMTGNEDTAILQYKAIHPDFPHETTGDQFYGEDQFESYRWLGWDVAHRAFATVIDEEKDLDTDHDIPALAEKLAQTCSPTLERVGEFTDQTERLMGLWEQVRKSPELKALDKGMVGNAWPADAPYSFRSQFYVCVEMIQLMENVYLDLNLEETWEHPDNNGWQVMFRTWSKSPELQRVWEMTCPIFGLRFRYFCERHLGLKVPVSGELRSRM